MSKVAGAKRPSAKALKDAYVKHGSVKKVFKARVFGRHGWDTYQKWYKTSALEGKLPFIRQGAKSRDQLKNPEKVIAEPQGTVKALPTELVALPKRGVKRYLFTSAQNDTKIFMPLWRNLLVLADHYNAEIHVSRFVYLANINAAQTIYDKTQAYDRMLKSMRDDGEERERQEISWEPELQEYLSDRRMEIAPGLVWCGEMNILPTAVHPLSGLEVYTGRKSAIVPHVKIAMQSIPSSKHAPTKFNYTTGTVTMRNYVQRKAGLKAQFHHCYGALLVEVTPDGSWYCRQINADSEGVIHDFDIRVANGDLTTGNRPDSITWADVHEDQLDKGVRELAWGKGGMLDILRPMRQFFHDVLGFRAKSHHELKMPHRLFRRYLLGETDVRKECVGTRDFLHFATRDWCDSIVVHSNHHDHLGRWLEEQDARFDPKNVEFWTAMQTKVYQSLRAGAQKPNYFLLMLNELNHRAKRLTVLDADQSFIICEDANGGIECGMHGHAGPNGGKGSPRSFARLGRKANIGHFHSAEIIDGVYVAGTCGILDPDWTTGPSSWSHSHILTYPNGKRAIVTMWKGAWRA